MIKSSQLFLLDAIDTFKIQITFESLTNFLQTLTHSKM